jgi:undecaprenyl-diphosphatase
MDLALLLKALILGLVEGFTEFLPISSTGHLILASQLLGTHDERGKMFQIVIQSGAMLAILWEYRARLFGALRDALSDRAALRFLVNVAVAFLPAALLGVAVGKLVKAQLFNAPTVATTFVLGGLVILWVERRARTPRIADVDEMTPLDALKIGLAQCFALIPGTSRSGATIIGGLLFGFSRRAATEFSFFLAIPTLLAAGAYDLYKGRELLALGDLGMWVVGLASAFASAFACVRWLLRYVATHDFRIFAWYRIAFGMLILLTWQLELVDWSAG